MASSFRFRDSVKIEAGKRQDGKCAYCGDELSCDTSECFGHHVVPVQSGDLSSPTHGFMREKDNCVILCRPCHNRVHQDAHFVDGPVAPVGCVAGTEQPNCPLYGGCAFIGTWSRARDAVNQVFDNTTFQDLIDQDPSCEGRHVADYCI